MRKMIGIMITLFIVIFAMSINSYAIDVNIGADLKSQLSADGENVVKLTSDIEMEQSIGSKGTKTLDLNGHTLTMKSSKYILVTGELTVTGNGTIITEGGSMTLGVNPGGKLTVENGTIRNNRAGGLAISIWGSDVDNGTKTKVTIGKNANLVASNGIAIYNDHTNSYGVEVNLNGAITSNQGIGITINGGVRATTGNVPIINVNDGSSIITNGGTAIYAAGYGIYNINGGKIEGSEAISIKSGIINVSGGKLIANGEYNLPVSNNNGTEPTGSAISITNNDTYAGKVVVNVKNNPVISSQNGYALIEATTKGTEGKVESISIKGGDFSGGKGSILLEHKEELGKIIEAGTFNSNISEYIKDTSMEFAKGEVYQVGPANDIVISETENGKIAISETRAIKGQLIKIDVMPNDGYELDTITVLGEDGKEVKVSNLQFVMPNNKVTVKAIFTAKVEVEKPQLSQPATPNETTTPNESTTAPTQATEIPKEGEKDDTPKTGLTNADIYISAIAVVLSLASIKFIKGKDK